MGKITSFLAMGNKRTAPIKFLKRIQRQKTPLKIVVVGSSNCGKSTFCNAWTQNQQINQNMSTNPALHYSDINRELNGMWEYKKQKRPFKLLDTKEGCNIYDRLRRLCYRDADIFLICYDVANRKSVERIRNQFIPEICHHEPTAKYLLLGLKNDDINIDMDYYHKIIYYWTIIDIEQFGNKLFVPNDISQIIIQYIQCLGNELVSQNQINELCVKYRLQTMQCSAFNFDGLKFNNDLYKIAKQWKVECG